MINPEQLCSYCTDHQYYYCIYKAERRHIIGKGKNTLRKIVPTSGPIDFALAKQIREATQGALRQIETEARSHNCPNV